MKNRNILRRIFSKQKSIFALLFLVRVLIIVGCISLVGARIFVGMNNYTMDKLLFEAVQAGDLPKVRELLEAGCNPDPLDEERNTPLYFTSFNTLYGAQYLDIMKLLLAFYAHVDQQNYRGETTLHGCVRIENFEQLRTAFSTLLSYGATISLEDRDGNTMLNELVRIDTMGAVDILLGSYADVFGINAIEQAIKQAYFYNYTDIIDYVLEKYLKQLKDKSFVPPKSRYLDEQLVAVLTRNHALFERIMPSENEVDAFGNNQLHLAVMRGDAKLVDILLLKTKKLAQVKNNNGSFPLHFVSRAGNSIETRKAILALFEKHGIDINQRDGTGSTLLHILIRKRDFPFVSHILRLFGQKIDRSIKDKNQETIKELLDRLDRSKLSILY